MGTCHLSKHHESHTLFANILNRYECTLALANNPIPIAEITTVRAINSELKSMLWTTSASYDALQYKMRLAGISMTDMSVDMAVMVTDKARSALN